MRQVVCENIVEYLDLCEYVINYEIYLTKN